MEQKYADCKVIENTEVIDSIMKMVVEGEFKIKPGQFFMLRAWDNYPFLSRAISVNDATDKTVTFLYQVIGKGTNILKSLKSGDSIKLLGPVGNGFDVEGIKGKVAVVAGGIGIAPMLYVVKNLKECQVDFYAGFRDKVYLIDEIEGYVNTTHIATEDGSIGYKGYVTGILDPKEYDLVLCCGPKVMMEAVFKICEAAGVTCYVSMEEKMACGVGACLGCTCKTKDGNKRVCKDGPVFEGREVFEC